MSFDSERLTAPLPETVRPVLVRDEDLPPIPDRAAIEAWQQDHRRRHQELKAALDENYDQERETVVSRFPKAVPPPPGTGAGHYQALLLDLQSGTLELQCNDWRPGCEEVPYRRGAEGWLWQGPEYVPARLYWTIESGVRELPYLTAAQGNALAELLAPRAQELLANLQPVDGTDEFDWTVEAFRIAEEIERHVQRDPGKARSVDHVLSMAEVVAAVPELIEPRWADMTGEELDERAPYFARSLRSGGDRELIGERLQLGLGERTPLVVVGVRAWLYGYRREMATGRQPMETERWLLLSGRELLVTADSTDAELVHLAQREQRAATDEGVLLIDALPALRSARARHRATLVRELEQVLGPRRVQALKDAADATTAAGARVDQILSWREPNENLAALGRAIGVSRQAIQARADKLRNGGEPFVEQAPAAAE